MISLSLAKLSTAQDAYPDEQNFQWKHETNSLICVIDSYQAGGSALQLLKVVQGTQVRERIELERLINEGHELMRSMQERGVELKADQLPISAIVRCPLLAIRWQLPSQKVRRLQIRFRANEDFDLVYTHLLHLGLRMTSPQSKDLGSSAGSEQAKITSRPLLQPTYLTAQPTGPSCPPSRLTEISNRPYTALNAPTAVESQIQETAHARPNSAFPSSSFAPQLDPLTPPMYFPRPASASVTSSEYPTSFPPHNQPLATTEPRDSLVTRPDTGLLYDRPDTAELPPRRALPFRRDSPPRSSGSGSVRPHSRPTTAVMGPPALPARVSDLRPGSARTTSLDSDLPPLRQPTIVSDTKRPVTPYQKRPDTPVSPSKGRGKYAQGMAVDEEQPSFPPASSSPEALPTPDSTSPFAVRPLSAVSTISQHPPQSTSPRLFASRTATMHKDSGGSTMDSAVLNNAENALKAYAMQSDDARKAALNDFFFKALDSDDFITLCEDVEANSARLGLGRW